MKNNFLFIKILSKTFEVVLVLLLGLGTAYAGSSWIPQPQDLAKIMSSLSDNLTVVIQLLVATSYVVGFWFVSSAVNELRIYGQARTMMPLNTSFTGPLSRLLVGIIMIFFPQIIDVSIYSLWGYGAEEASLLRFDTTGSSQWDDVMKGIRLLVQTFGYVSVIRGFIMLSRSGKQGAQPGSFGKGLMHILGGVMAVNIVATVKLIQATLGFA